MPSKFYGIAAAGRPTIFVGDDHAEIARLLEANGCGFTVPSGDGEALANRILELAGDRNLCATLGARARFAFEREWDKEQTLAKWEDLLALNDAVRRQAQLQEGIKMGSSKLPSRLSVRSSTPPRPKASRFVNHALPPSGIS